MFEYRVTKYDPGNRDRDEGYCVDEWTSWSHVGEIFGNRLLTIQDYWKVEDAYVIAAVHMLSESGVDSLCVSGLKNEANYVPETFDLREGAVLAGNQLQHAVRCLLREYFWCRLEDDGKAYLHVGPDLHLYIGVPRPVPESIGTAHEAGLFVCAFASPYKTLFRGKQPN